MKKILFTGFIFLISYTTYSDEIIKTKDGKQVILKDNFTWEYADQKSTEIKNAQDAVSIWDKALLRTDGEYDKRVGLYLHYQNNTGKKIIGIISKVSIKNPFGKEILNTTFEDEIVLQPNEKQKNDKYWVFKDNPFIDGEPYDKMWSMADNGTAQITAKVLKVIFEDGTVLINQSDNKLKKKK